MTRLNSLPQTLNDSLRQRNLLKVISGLSNFDGSSVSRIASASGLGGADLLDVACDPYLVGIALEKSGLPICVSAVDASLFPAAVKAGASMIEIGNFDSFYPQGRVFSAEEVIELAIETRSLLPDVVLSVTVPHVLPLDKQAQLALDLVDVGADLIQTEGGTSSTPKHPGTLGLIEKAAPTLAAAHMINASLIENGSSVPILCASGLSVVTVPMAFSVGATGVGVGSVVNRLSDELEMIAMIRNLRQAIMSSRSLAPLTL